MRMRITHRTFACPWRGTLWPLCCMLQKKCFKCETEICTRYRRSLSAPHSILAPMYVFHFFCSGLNTNVYQFYATFSHSMGDSGSWVSIHKHTTRECCLNSSDAAMSVFCLPLAFALFAHKKSITLNDDVRLWEPFSFFPLHFIED